MIHIPFVRFHMRKLFLYPKPSQCYRHYIYYTDPCPYICLCILVIKVKRRTLENILKIGWGLYIAPIYPHKKICTYAVLWYINIRPNNNVGFNELYYKRHTSMTIFTKFNIYGFSWPLNIYFQNWLYRFRFSIKPL